MPLTRSPSQKLWLQRFVVQFPRLGIVSKRTRIRPRIVTTKTKTLAKKKEKRGWVQRWVGYDGGKTMGQLSWQDTKRHFICPVAEGRNPSCSSWRLPSIGVSFYCFSLSSSRRAAVPFTLCNWRGGDRFRRFIPPFTASFPASYLQRDIPPKSFHLL